MKAGGTSTVIARESGILAGCSAAIPSIRRLNLAGFPWERSPCHSPQQRIMRFAPSGRWTPRKPLDLLAKAILELAASIEATDAKVKKMNKAG